ncbi:MAG: hypothetical protein ACF8OB_18990 [Phycisphaeraceae bacterium JB051]
MPNIPAIFNLATILIVLSLVAGFLQNGFPTAAAICGGSLFIGACILKAGQSQRKQ